MSQHSIHLNAQHYVLEPSEPMNLSEEESVSVMFCDDTLWDEADETQLCWSESLEAPCVYQTYKRWLLVKRNSVLIDVKDSTTTTYRMHSMKPVTNRIVNLRLRRK